MRPLFLPRITVALLTTLALLSAFQGACTNTPPGPTTASTGAGSVPPAATSQPHALQPDSPESIGSLRNARVAYPMPGGQRPTVTFLAGNLSPQQLAELHTIAPNLRIISGLTPQQAITHAGEATGIDARFATPALLDQAVNLVWVQAMSAGVEHLLSDDQLSKSDRIDITNMRAVHGPAIADHAFAMLLTLTRNMREHAENQAQGHWSRDGGAGGGGGGGDDKALKPIALQGRTMLVVGLGGIGTEIAQRAKGFGMRITAIRRSDTPSPAYVERTGHAEDLPAMLPEADVVAICLPLTPETQGLFGPEAFAAMKPGAYLINISRGQIVDTQALLAALDSRGGGRLAGAGLDVTDPEPLPDGHPLWKHPHVVITPHVASDAELTEERRWTILRENLRRFAAGEPLLNVVDKRAGY